MKSLDVTFLFLNLPNKKKLLQTGCFLLCTGLTTLVLASGRCVDKVEYKTTQTFFDVVNEVAELKHKWKTRDILLVFDIDNTLLTMEQDLGSDQWFDWQFDLLQQKNNNDLTLTANNFLGLLDTQALLWRLGKMHPAEQEQPELVKALQAQGFTTLLLTSRGPENLNITDKALVDNGYHFEDSALPPKQGIAGVFLPFNFNLNSTNINITSKNITDHLCYDRNSIFIPSCRDFPRPVQYSHGILLASGQDKGKMLTLILEKTGFTKAKRFRVIVFVDDKEKYINQVHRAFCNRSVDLHLFHYVHEQNRVNAFRKSNKKEIIKKWLKVKELLILMRQ